MQIHPAKSLIGTVAIPGDKSISHRSIMFGSLALGKTTIFNFLMGEDCLSTIDCFRTLGIPIEVTNECITVHGKGLYGLTKPTSLLDCGNSGTTVRLLTGILSGQNFPSTLTGDASIQKRPMNRVIQPLTQMGATIIGVKDNFCPLEISPNPLNGISYHSPVASAQVKSAILLAGLYADSPTTVTEPALSRDHTERMLRSFGATLHSEGTTSTIIPNPTLVAQTITVPGDISSAAFFMVAASIVPNSKLLLTNVGINPTRRGVLDVLLQMGANITLCNEREVNGEPVCDMEVLTAQLTGTTIGGAIIPTLIDEIPILAVAACFAKGTTIIKDASELKVKESNRIDTLYKELSKLGATITPTEDGLIIEGGSTLYGTNVESYNDHRIAMSLAIAGLLSIGNTTISNSQCVDISFPNFFKVLTSVIKA